MNLQSLMMGEFETNCKEFYPSELEFEQENIGYYEESFLDSGIKIEQNEFNVQLYDRRDDFLFLIRTSK